MKASNYFGILIGVNEYADPSLLPLKYAEKDCLDMFSVLSDKNIGLFKQENMQLILGEKATRDAIHKSLRDVLSRSVEDTVLIYFSGHAVSVGNEVYFLPSDVSLKDINDDPFMYLSLRRMREEIFQKSQAKNIIIILDTCSSGSSFPSERGVNETQNVQNEIVKVLRMEPDPEGKYSRSLLVSSPPNVPSREVTKLENGLFTHYLLLGLQKKDEYEVTVDLLVNFIKENMEHETTQPPGTYTVSYNRVVLTRPKGSKAQPKQFVAFPEPEITDTARFSDLKIFSNTLEAYEEFVRGFTSNLKDFSMSLPLAEQRVLHSIRLCTGADFAILVKKENGGWMPQQYDCGDGILAEPLISKIIPDSVGALRSLENEKPSDGETKVSLGVNITGIGCQIAVLENKKQILLISVTRLPEQQILILYGDIGKISYFINDSFSLIISGIYSGLREIPSAHPDRLDAYVYDWLRIHHYVPKSFYDHREKTFLARLKNMTVRFQPIINIESDEAYIDGFEALANDPEYQKTPHDIFRAAEIWGSRFMIAVDTHIFNYATTTYFEQLKSTPGRRRPEDALDLSINVYPESLIRTKYFQNVKTVVSKNKLPRRKLFLEISEKSEFPVIVPGDGVADENITSFRDVLRKYVNEIGIGFAIDDFGVGRSSVARLADLTPSYLKIDREILSLETAYDTLEFITKFAKKIVSQRVLVDVKIVLEGFDEEISKKLSLQKIKSLGVDHIQSYIIGMPTEKIVRLTEEQRKLLTMLVNT